MTNLGAILSFAVEMEEKDIAFYESLAGSASLGGHAELFGTFAADEKQNLKTILRARREHVTEMILEPIAGFSREPFVCHRGESSRMSADEALAAAEAAEKNAVAFLQQAAGKLGALPEAALVLKSVSKRRSKHLSWIAFAATAAR